MFQAELLKIRTATSTRIIALVAIVGLLLVQGMNLVLPSLLPKMLADTDQASREMIDSIGVSTSSLSLNSAAYQRSMIDVLGNGAGNAINMSLGVVAMAMLVMGILAATSDFRHSSIVPSALASPRRGRIALAKAGAVATVTAAFGLVCVVISVGTLLIATSTSSSAELLVSAPEILATLGQGLGALVLIALVGLGIGLIVRSQVTALVIVFGVLLLEPIVQAVAQLAAGSLPAALQILPSSLSKIAVAPIGTAGLAFDPAIAGLVLAAWTVAALVIGGTLLKKRDLI